MKNVKIKYSQLLFLYAYLRLIDLSLDRSRWGEWDSFLVYFTNIVYPTQIIQYIKESFDFIESDLHLETMLPKKKTVIYKFKRFVFNDLSLRRDKILYCYKLLLEFEILLKSDDEQYNTNTEQLRQNIARYYTEVLENSISRKDLKILMRIEHFNKSDNVDAVKLDKFIPDDF